MECHTVFFHHIVIVFDKHYYNMGKFFFFFKFFPTRVSRVKAVLLEALEDQPPRYPIPPGRLPLVPPIHHHHGDGTHHVFSGEGRARSCIFLQYKNKFYLQTKTLGKQLFFMVKY